MMFDGVLLRIKSAVDEFKVLQRRIEQKKNKASFLFAFFTRRAGAGTLSLG